MAKVSFKGMVAIAREEAVVLTTYDDVGRPAIGVGHNDPNLKPGQKITLKEAFEFFAKDLEGVEKAITKNITVPLVQHQVDALAMFIYNLGSGTFAKSSIDDKINAGDLEGAMDILEQYCKARNSEGVLEVKAGLVARRKRERELFLTGNYGNLTQISVWEGDPKTTKPVKMTVDANMFGDPEKPVTVPPPVITKPEPVKPVETTPQVLVPLKISNQDAQRNLDVEPLLLKLVQESVTKIYGPKYSLALMSGGQGEGGGKKSRGTTGSIRHNVDSHSGIGLAGDFVVKDEKGEILYGQRLIPLAVHWLSSQYGSVGLPNEGSGSFIHLDLVGGTTAKSRPLKKGEGRYWNYGGWTKGTPDILAKAVEIKVSTPEPVQPKPISVVVPVTPEKWGETNWVEKPAGKWNGTVGLKLTKEQFPEYIKTLSFGAWKPQFAVVHNTGAPTLKRWHEVAGETRMINLTHYYKNEQGWSAGPHLFVADDFIWVFSPLTKPGTHSPSWNSIAWGIEIVGDYDVEQFSKESKENLIVVLDALHKWAGISIDTLKFHKEDTKTTHKNCPGKNVVKADLIKLVKAYQVAEYVGEHTTEDEVKVIPPKVEIVTPPTAAPLGSVYIVSSGDTLYSISKKMGISVDEIKKLNNLVDANIKPFQVLRIDDKVKENSDYVNIETSETVWKKIWHWLNS